MNIIILTTICFFLFYSFYKKLTQDEFLSFVNKDILKKVKNFKIRNFNNDNINEAEMLKFLENQKRTDLEIGTSILGNVLYIITSLKYSDTREKLKQSIKDTYNKEMKKIIEEDLQYKEFRTLMNSIHFELTDFYSILKDPEAIIFAKKLGLIEEESLKSIYNNVFYSKINYNDEKINNNITKIKNKILELINRISTTNKEK